MKKKVFFGFLLAVALCTAILGIGISRAAFPGEGLTISPPIIDIAAKPGQTVEQTITVTNPTQNLVVVYPKVMDFRAKGDGGEPDFYSASDEMAKFSISKWITFTQPKLALTPEQVVEFKYTISVPSGAEPGGHYGAVFFATEPPKNDNTKESKVSLSSMVGSLVLAKVPGDIKEQGSLDKFSINNFLHLKNDAVFIERIHNAGNIHFKPRGFITIKSLTGKKIDELEVNPQAGNVLPDSTRKFENKWDTKKILFGLYTAELNVSYGDSNQKIVSSLKFFILPWWALIIIIVVLILIIFLTRLLTRKIRKRKRIKRPKKPNDGGKIILR